MTRFQIRKNLRKAGSKAKTIAVGALHLGVVNVAPRQSRLGIRKAGLKLATVTILGTPLCLGLASGANAAVIGNGTVQLGINQEGHLNSGGVGLKFLPTNGDGIYPGCKCEGWGVADASTGVRGYGSIDNGGISNLDVLEFITTDLTAKSVVKVGDTFKVTHEYTPTKESEYLYRALVTIENIGSNKVGDLRYRRAMDWDIPPTTFNESVTLKTSGASNVLFTSNNGFANVNPLAGPSDLGAIGEFVDNGPKDHGALFDFGFGELTAGVSRTFEIFYGAAPDEAKALAALAAVGADKVYSLGQAAIDPTGGTPNTFMFAFKGVGEPPSEPVPEPLTILGTLTAGGMGVAMRLKKKQQEKEAAKV